VTAALKYLTAGAKLKLSFSSENEAKNPAIRNGPVHIHVRCCQGME